MRALTQDYLLWNRLGSSLSNGNKPEESLGAYREALVLRPTYTRAIYNVGVACKWLLSAVMVQIIHSFSCRPEHWCVQGGGGTFLERTFHARGNRGEEQAIIADAPPSSPLHGLFSRSDIGRPILMCVLYTRNAGTLRISRARTQIWTFSVQKALSSD